MIEIKNLSKKFGKNQVLKDVNLQLNGHGVFAILGPNGSGKTTLIKCILGMVIPSSGEILIEDLSIHKKWKYRENISYLPQITNFPSNLTVKELFKMIKDLRSSKTKNEQSLVSKFRLEPHLNKKLGTLSGGTKQKVNLVLTFLCDSPILILDEPTTGLDPSALIILKELIAKEKQKGKLILLTSHIMSFVEEIADEIIFLLEGNVYFQGTSKSLKEDTKESDFEHAISKLLTINQND